MTGIAYVFPGQGSQQVGMGQNLYASSTPARAIFDRADEILQIPLSRLCFEGPADELTDTINAQPAILTTSIAMLEAARAAGAPPPDWVAGHSLGHFSALVAAGALDFEAALRLVRARGVAMQRAGAQQRGGMAAVIRLDAGPLDALCAQVRAQTGEYVGIANDNSPGQVVITGQQNALELAMQRAREAGARRVVALPVSVASHSPLMADAARAIEALLEQVNVQEPHTPVLSNVTSRPVGDTPDIRRDIVQQLTGPVRWTETIQNLASMGAQTFVEIGPGNVLTGLVKRILSDPLAWSLSDADGMSQLVGQIAGE
jgi:[acyl-carrier-protein] S-malonyltransferase